MKKAVGKVEPVKKLWLSKEEAMAYLGVSEDFLRDLRNNAKVSFAQDGRKILRRDRSLKVLYDDVPGIPAVF